MKNNTLKKFGKSILSLVSPVLNIFVNYKNYYRKRKIKSFLIVKSIQKEFKMIGSNPYFEFPFELRGLEYISIGKNFKAGEGLVMEAWDNYFDMYYFNPSIEIGDNVCLMNNCQISAIDKVKIGNNVLVGRFVFISDNGHGDASDISKGTPPGQRKPYSKGPVIIEDNVWIGRGVAIMPNVRIGKNSIIGANSVVTHDIPPNSVAVGSPAKVVKTID